MATLLNLIIVVLLIGCASEPVKDDAPSGPLPTSTAGRLPAPRTGSSGTRPSAGGSKSVQPTTPPQLTPPPPAMMSTPSRPIAPAPRDWLELSYGKPEPLKCIKDEDCGTGCCRQIGNQYRECYSDSDSACHLEWAQLPPSYLPRWDLSKKASYTGSFAADVVTAVIADVWQSERSRIYKLSNGQYWEEHVVGSATPRVGDEVRVAPSPFFYSMDLGKSESASDLLGVSQVPVLVDAEVMGPFAGMERQGLYAIAGAGYWRVFEDSPTTQRRVLLTSPNNVDFWLYTADVAEGAVDPAEVYADGDAVQATETNFTLDDGSRWGYVIDNPFDPVPVGARAVVFKLSFFDDRRDDNRADPYCWHEGGSSFGEWVSPL